MVPIRVKEFIIVETPTPPTAPILPERALYLEINGRSTGPQRIDLHLDPPVSELSLTVRFDNAVSVPMQPTAA